MEPLVFVVAGEPSGDVLGAGLMAALREETAGAVRFAGVGGPAMEAEGLASIFPMTELAVMGLVEVLPSLRRILLRLAQTAAVVREMHPDIVVTIDAQGFSHRLAHRLVPAPCPIIQYVAPTVWAWKPWRAKRLAGLVDRVLLLFPFEKPYWDAVGLDAVEVGHPAAAAQVPSAVRKEVRQRLLQGRVGPLLAVLPGSRGSVVRRHLPIFRETVERLAARHAELVVVLPTVPSVADQVRRTIASWPVPTSVAEGDAEVRLQVMAAADLALAASGTVALELAAVGTPHIIAYRANPVTAAIVRRMIRIEHVSPVNLVAGRRATPELIQEDCTAPHLAAAMEDLLGDSKALTDQRRAMADVMTALGRGGDSPSLRAARAVIDLLGRPRRA